VSVSIDEALAGIGRRVSVRRVVGSRDGRPLFSDVVGVLQSSGDDVVVRRRDRTTVSFPRAAVVAAKLVPAAGLLLADRDLEEIAALGWRGGDTERVGDWLLRAAQGFTGRANSVLTVGDPGVPFSEAVARVVRWYGAHDLPPRFQVPMPHASHVDAWLAEHGWRAHDEVRVLIADLDPLLPGPGDDGVRVDDEPDGAWIAAYHYRGGDLPPYAQAVIERGDTLGFASVRSPAGDVLAIARGSVDRGWLGVTAVEVDTAARRQGLAGAVLRALAGWAAGHGARSCYLQVAVENAPALALYLGTGFVDHHRYHYRLPGPEQAR
jgi:ribosomal protein S18 acetylase RimI-like enzyme